MLLVPFELQLQRPNLVLRILKECHGCEEVAHAVAPDLWQNRDVVLELFRCCDVMLPRGRLAQFDSDEELWLQVACEDVLHAFASFGPLNFRYDRTFLPSGGPGQPRTVLDYFTKTLCWTLISFWPPASRCRSCPTSSWTVTTTFTTTIAMSQGTRTCTPSSCSVFHVRFAITRHDICRLCAS